MAVFFESGFFFVTIFLVVMVLMVDADIYNSNCSLAQTCSECISIAKECKWCRWDKFDSGSRSIGHGNDRCGAIFDEHKCPPQFQTDPKPSQSVWVLEDRPFSDSIEQTVQLRPQRLRIDTRVGHWTPVEIEFKQARDYPMDLYYLMDISCTMLKHKTSVSRVGRKLASKIQQTTKDFRIGFGSYVDKETIPFSNYKFDSKINCNKQSMVNTYSFINHMPLSANVSEFEHQVQSAKISGNLDSPEGTLDALMQTMVCPREIGWRDHSDKIIVVATDEEFHYAGDGKLGGILIPNDGKCHLVNGRYVASTIYDYPSMYHISEVAQQKKFNLVFTVSDLVSRQYHFLSEVIGANSRVASLKDNDDTIAELIDDVYRNISNQIELIIEEQPNYVDVEVFTKCGQPDQPLRHTQRCKFSGKATISFEIKIRLKRCPKNESESKLIRIGLLNKDGTVEIHMNGTCRCDCEIHEAEPDSPKCSNNGTFSCGICTTCNGIRSGQRCECDPDKPIDPRRPDAHCRADSNSRPCNGRGQCVCAKCMCEPMFAGQFCQEDQSACYRNGLKCGGHGQCGEQAKCRCDPGFRGQFCDCPLSNHTCVTNQESGELCFGRGECHCGQCKCSVPTSMGRFCQHCAQCDHQKHCELLRTCVPNYRGRFCRPYFDMETNRTITPKCDPKLCQKQRWNYQVEMVDKETIYHSNSSPIIVPQGQLIWFQDQCSQIINGCVVAFDYRLMKASEEFMAAETSAFGFDSSHSSLVTAAVEQLELNFIIKNLTESCPIRINMVQVALGSFASVILAGLIGLCILKCVANYFDHREYERFKREIEKANFALSENPLYKEVTSQFRNPVFGIRDRTSKFFFNKK